MIYDIKAIPTTYKSTMFRSRLEARWAAFFDLLEWKWLYEPVDFNGWIPDFQLLKLPSVKNGFGEQYIHDSNPFVEVKPFNDLNDIDQFLPKVQAAIPDGLLVIFLGTHPFMTQSYTKSGYDDVIHMDNAYTDGCNSEELWNIAGNLVQWKPPREEERMSKADEAFMLKSWKRNGLI